MNAKIKLAAAVAVMVTGWAALSAPQSVSAAPAHPHGRLVFNQEFNGPLSGRAWSSSWFGRTPRDDVAVRGGDLVIRLGGEVDTDPAQTGGHGFTIGTGYTVRARVYLPGHGDDIFNWPAVWTTSDQWPKQGEVDIAEGLGQLTTNYHSPSGAHNFGGPAGNWAGWHTYELVRLKGRNLIYWDSRLVRSYRTDDDGGREYLVFDVAWGHTADVHGVMLVAWVKVRENG